MKYLLLFFITITSCLLFGQAENQGLPSDIEQYPQFQDVVYLKGGNILRGKIISYEPGVNIEFVSWNGVKLNFDSKIVTKVVQERIDMTRRAAKREQRNTYKFREKGIYNTTDLSINFGQDMDGKVIPGFSIDNVTGYQFHRLIGAGVGVGYETFQMGAGQAVIPVFGEVRGYLLKNMSTPMFRMQLGYGFGVKNERNNIVKTNGGLLVHPAIGYRFGAGSAANFTIDFGYKIQKASYTQPVWDGTWTQHHTFKRYTLRLGMLF